MKSAANANARYTAHYLPLFQIVGELEPAKRQILLTHLDEESTRALARSVTDLLRHSDLPVDAARKKRIRRAVDAHRPAFKTILRGRGGIGKRREALTAVGGGPLALLLSTAIPLILGQILKK